MSEFADLARRYAFGSGVLKGVTEGFEGDDWFHRAGEGNHAQWLVGHLAMARRTLVRTAGGDVCAAEAWEALFDMKARPTAESDAVPVADLLAAFHDAGERLASTLKALAPEKAAETLHHALPDGSDDVGGFAHFMHFHESYHLGQLGLLRRSLGKPGLI